MSAPLVVEGLHVSYGGRPVLRGVTLEVEPGRVCALLGRNGEGKSSLVRCALGMQKPDAGQARLFGADAWRTRAHAMRRVGVVPEEPDGPPEATARELLRFCGALYARWEGAEAEERLRRFEVPLDVPFGRLSKGQKGAVMLALALAHRPELLVLDDPTLGLDVVARRALYDELIGELADRGTSVLVTSHDLTGMETIASRVAILRDGRLVAHEDVEELKTRYRRIRRAAGAEAGAWGPFEVVTSVARTWGEEAVVSNFDESRLRAFQAGTGTAELEIGTLSLEEIFVATSQAPRVAAS